VTRTILPTDMVGTIAGSSPFVVPPWLTLRQAASEMAANTCGLLVVLTPRHRIGVVSERDIVGAIADGADVDATRISEVMTDEVIHVPPETTLADVAGLMERNEVRHVLVVSEDTPVAVLSVRDLLPLVTRTSAVT
jgi:CBS domain-containing protein